MTNDEPHDCKLKEKGFCECTKECTCDLNGAETDIGHFKTCPVVRDDINLGLNAEEEAQALDAIEHGSEATLSDEKPH